MAITYHLTGKSQGEGKGVSAYFWELIRPLSERNPKDVTNYLLDVITHPTTGEEAILVDSNVFMIHPNTNDLEIDERTEQLENHGVITAQEKTGLRTAIKSLKGQEISVLDLMPIRYKVKPFVKTYEEMEADGWFTPITD